MVYPREVLNELKWHRGRLEDAQIIILHRGAPGDRKVIPGSDIVELGRSFFVTAESMIPVPPHPADRARRRAAVPGPCRAGGGRI